MDIQPESESLITTDPSAGTRRAILSLLRLLARELVIRLKQDARSEVAGETSRSPGTTIASPESPMRTDAPQHDSKGGEPWQVTQQ